ncbi:unnamed protein product, partial [Adineta ricciae]
MFKCHSLGNNRHCTDASDEVELFNKTITLLEAMKPDFHASKEFEPLFDTCNQTNSVLCLSPSFRHSRKPYSCINDKYNRTVPGLRILFVLIEPVLQTADANLNKSTSNFPIELSSFISNLSSLSFFAYKCNRGIDAQLSDGST